MTATAWPTPPRWRSPSCPGRRTTRCSSTRRPGLGKTHLLHAIGNYVEQFGGGARVRYTTVEEFTNHFVAAIAGRTTERFKRTYRDADVLLIDDVQFLASKVKTEEEFFHTFNALYETGRQLVFTADRLPVPARRGSPSGCASASRPGSWRRSRRRTSPPGSRSCASAPRSTGSRSPIPPSPS